MDHVAVQSEASFRSSFRRQFKAALAKQAETDWPLVRVRVEEGQAGLAQFAACVLIHSEPWLVEGTLSLDPNQGPPIVSGVQVEHFPKPDREVTGSVLRLPLARIRDRATAQLPAVAIGRNAMADAGGWSIRPEDVAVAELAAAEAERPKRGRQAKSPEHYRRIAFRYLELLRDGKRHVLKELAAEESERLGRTVPRETVRDWVRKATRLGYLAPGTAGRADPRPGPNLYLKEENDG